MLGFDKWAISMCNCCVISMLSCIGMGCFEMCILFNCTCIIWARSCENVSYAICDQQRCRSACASVASDHVRCLDSMICILAISKVSKFSLEFYSVAEQAGLNLTWSKIPEDTFSHGRAHIASIDRFCLQ